MNVTVRLAVDRDGSRTVQPEEVVSKVAELAPLDRDGRGRIDGDEIRDVYFEYSPGEWLAGGQTHRRASEGWTTELRLEAIELDPPSLDLKISFRPTESRSGEAASRDDQRDAMERAVQNPYDGPARGSAAPSR